MRHYNTVIFWVEKAIFLPVHQLLYDNHRLDIILQFPIHVHYFRVLVRLFGIGTEENARQRTQDNNGSSILFLSMGRGADAEREEHRIIVFIIIHGLMRLLRGMRLCVSGFSECGFIS